MPLTVANQLTLLRMGLTPLFLILMLNGRYGWALVTFVAAAVTDALDGIIARVWKQKTELGAYLDPLADKMLLTTALLCLAFLDLPNTLPLWLTILFIARDVILSILVLVIVLTTSHRKFRPSLAGKATTFFQLVLLLDALFYNWLGRESGHLQILLWCAVAATAASAIEYGLRASRLLAEAEPPKQG